MKAAKWICQQIFLHFGTSVFWLHVGLEQCEVWGREECKCEV